MKEITVGLLWHSLSSGNLGVGALSVSQISISEAAAARADVKVRYVLIGRRGPEDYDLQGIDVEVVPNMTLKSILIGRTPLMSSIRSCDLVLDISEGDSFADIYGMKRFMQQSISKLAVLFSGTSLVLSPQTIGPFNRLWCRVIASQIMRRCTLVFARDEMSFGYLHDNGIASRAKEAIDVAFRLPFSEFKLGVRGNKIRMGLNISALLYNGGYGDANQFGMSFDYSKFINRLLSVLLARKDVEVHIVPHVLASEEVEDDYALAVSIARDYEGLKLPDRFSSPGDAKAYISTLDFFVGSRMHACIGAFSSGVPVIPVGYSRKFEGLFNTLDYPFVADGITTSEEDILDKILWGLSELDTLRERVAHGNALAAARLQEYEDALVELYLETSS